MAITYPLDILADWPGWTPTFELVWRQELSRQANGVTRVKDLGPPVWRMTAVSRPLRANELDAWRARLDALESGAQTFKGYSLSRCYPIRYPNGTWPTGASFDGVSATVASINANRKALTVDLLPAGFVLSVGDMISIASGTKVGLHRVMEAATANGSGVTGEFEVRPHLLPGADVDDVVSVKSPHCLMMIVPGTISSEADPQTGIGRVSFDAIEART